MDLRILAWLSGCDMALRVSTGLYSIIGCDCGMAQWVHNTCSSLAAKKLEVFFYCIICTNFKNLLSLIFYSLCISRLTRHLRIYVTS